MGVISVKISENGIKYPAVVHYKKPSDQDGLILLMSTERVGTVIHSMNHQEIGSLYHDWDPEYCSKYEGSITLSNE